MRPRNDSKALLAPLSATVFAALFLLSCQQDGALDANTPAPPVALAPRITVAPEDTAFFNRTKWVHVAIEAGDMQAVDWIAFDAGKYVFKGVPANTNYTMSFDGYLEDKQTRVWSATRNGKTGTTNVQDVLPAAMAPTPLLIQGGETFLGGVYTTPQTIEIWTRGADSVCYRQGQAEGDFAKYQGGPLPLDRTGDLYVKSYRNGEVVASVSIPYQYTPASTEKAGNPTITPMGGAVYETAVITIRVTTGVFDLIEYSTDSASWTRYQNQFEIGTTGSTGKIHARSIRGADTSATTTASYVIQAPKPVFKPDTTRFSDTARILIQASGADSIEYRLDEEPWKGRKSDTITAIFTASSTLRVRSHKKGLAPDSAERVIKVTSSILPPAPAPGFPRPSDTLDGPEEVSIQTDGADSIIVWSSETDADTIRNSSGNWMVKRSGTVYARAYKAGCNPTDTSRTFVLRGPTLIRFSPEPGSFTDSQTIVIESPNADTLFIRIGGRPEKVYPSSSVKIFLDTTTRIDVRARRNGMDVTDSRDITIRPPQPLLEPARDTFEVLDTVKISSPRGDLVTYTLDGSKWDTVQGYFKLLPITKNETIRAKAWRGGTSSDVVEGRYTVIPREPSFDITRDTFGLAIDVTIHAASPADSIEYSIDGGAWTLAPAASKTLHIANTQTVSAWAMKNGERSAAITKTYVIDPPIKPFAVPDGGPYGTGLSIVFRSPGADSIQLLGDPADSTSWITMKDSAGSISESSVHGLWLPTTYHLRAFKHGAASTTFIYTFPISDFGMPWKPGVSYAPITDKRDGKIYKGVTYGRRTWLAQNLDYRGPGDTAIGKCLTDLPDSCKKYGRLYTWAEALGLNPTYNNQLYPNPTDTMRGICPETFRVPNAEDMDSLYALAGGDVGSAGALKSTGGWSFDLNGTDAIGFRLAPAGSLAWDRTWSQYIWIEGASTVRLITSAQLDATTTRPFIVNRLDQMAQWKAPPADYLQKKDYRSLRCVRINR